MGAGSAGLGRGAGLGEGRGRGDGKGAGLGLGVDPQVGHIAIEFVSNVTEPVEASALPLRIDPVVTVILTSARILPRKLLPVPKITELPTTQ
jgi:hypothetical protein